jgi:uncharacterized protein YijF (DUF1287 family)
LSGLSAICIASQLPLRATPSNGQRLAQAARAQVGVTLGYDPNYTHVSYPNGDVPRSTGVCADVILRAARDGLGLDLQKLVHEDMLRAFDAYPARRTWGSRAPDTNIDHRRVLNLEAYWQRAGAQLWKASNPTPGDEFPAPLEVGDIFTWRLDARLPHVGIIVSVDLRSGGQQARVVHNVGNGAEETPLSAFHPHRAAGHYRWPIPSEPQNFASVRFAKNYLCLVHNGLKLLSPTPRHFQRVSVSLRIGVSLHPKVCKRGKEALQKRLLTALSTAKTSRISFIPLEISQKNSTPPLGVLLLLFAFR